MGKYIQDGGQRQKIDQKYLGLYFHSSAIWEYRGLLQVQFFVRGRAHHQKYKWHNAKHLGGVC